MKNKSEQRKAAKGKTFGNLDKDQKYEIPEDWTKSEDFVVLRQERAILVDGKIAFVDAHQPIQLWPREQYARNIIEDPQSKRTGFQDLGLRITVLHDSEAGETAEIAETVQDEVDEIQDNAIPNPAGDSPEEKNDPNEPNQ